MNTITTNEEYRRYICKSCKHCPNNGVCEFENITRTEDKNGVITIKCKDFEPVNYKRENNILILLRDDDTIINEILTDASIESVHDILERINDKNTIEPLEPQIEKELKTFGYDCYFGVDLEPAQKNPRNYKNIVNVIL